MKTDISYRKCRAATSRKAISVSTHHCPELSVGERDWSSHPRLQRHVRLFRGHKCQAAVLSRYAKARFTLGQEALQRHACHVAAWVALLPVDMAACPCNDECGLSPVRLLALFLHQVGGGPLSQWLHGVLTLVSARLKSQDVASSIHQEHWEELSRCMPSALAGNATREFSKVAEDAESGTPNQAQFAARALKRFNMHLLSFSNQSLTDRRRTVEELEYLVSQAIEISDWTGLCDLLNRVCAAIAPPRVQSEGLDARQAATEQDASEIQDSNLQGRLRRLLNRGWAVLDLHDEGTRACLKPGLSHVANLIKDFETAHGRELQESKVGKQWKVIKHACVMGSEPRFSHAYTRWEDRAVQLEDWVASHNRLPARYATEDTETRLATWIRHQQEKLKDLSKRQLKRLRCIPGMSSRIEKWQNPVQWEDRCVQIQQWIEAAGRLPKHHAEEPQERFLSKWLNNQQQRWHAGKLAKNRKRKLQSMPGLARVIKRWEHPVRWEDRCAALHQWVQFQGRLPKHHASSTKEKSLAIWISMQQQRLRVGKLKSNQVEQLEKVPGMSARFEKWEKEGPRLPLNSCSSPA